MVTVMADTGAQTVIPGPEVMTLLGVPQSYLVQTRQKIIGITNNTLYVLGALLVRISAYDRDTWQIVYVCKNTKVIYLSQSALTDVVVIPEDFPTANSFCLAREDVAEDPQEIPFHPTAETEKILKNGL